MKKIFTIFAALACMMSMSAATWTVAGAPKAVFGSEWDPANTANVMADQGDGNYKWEKSDLTLAASTIEFKVVKGNAWGEEYPGANYRLKINESGVYTITITFNEGTHEVNAVATKQGAAEVIPTIELAGDMTNWADGKLEFTMAADELTASLTIPLEAQDYFFKMIIAGGWTSDGATITRENNTTVFTGANSDNNCTLTADVAGDYTFTWVYKTNTLTVTYPEAGENPGEEPGDDPVVTPDPETGVTYTVTVPVGTKACYIAGEMNEWKHQEMTKVDETHYTITIATATATMKYKYCSGPDWAYVEMQADGATDVQDRTYAANDVVEAWKAVYDPAGEEPGDDPVVDPETGITYNVTVPAGTKACYIAGEMNSWSFTEMTKIDDTHYTVTLAEATEAMGYKYCSGPGWAYVELTEEGGEVANRTYAANDIVVKWASIYDPANAPTPGEAKDITIKAKVPATWTETITAWVWATGEPGKAVTPTKDGEWYVYTEHCPELNIIFRNGSEWSTVDNKTVDMTFTESTCVQLAQEGGDMATYTVVDCEGGEVIEPAQITYVLMGVGGDWTTGIYLTRNVTALEEEYVLLNQPIAEGDSVKVVTLTDGIPTAWCGNVDEASTVSYTNDEVYGNIVLIPGIYDFYYKVASNMIYIATSITTAVDNITIEKNAIKVIQDGRMYIVRDGVMYNAVGQIAE